MPLTSADLFALEDYRQVYESVALPVLIIDHASWRILAVNEAALAQYGYTRDEFVGLPVLEVRPPEGREDARRVMSELPHGFWKTVAVKHCRKDGSIFSADVWSRDTVVDGRAVRIATIHEVTERLQLQQELQQAQKMEVVGRLAGGIAHDFNNALTVIMASSDFLLDQVETEEARADIERIREAADRTALLTRRLLAFSRRQVMRADMCTVADLIERTADLLKRVLEDQVQLQTRIDPDGWPVRVDAIQFEHVIMNMAVNAQEAMPAGGTLILASGNFSVSREDAARDPAVPPGDYAVLTLADTGIGMDETTRARVFEPFFTLKPPPTGTGLGLSMAYGIVRQSGGFITVESEPGVGTTFRILLPRVHPDGAVTTLPHDELPPVGRMALVVDSDEGVRRSTCRVLEGLGYTSVPAASAEDALAVLCRPGVVPALLVTALSLPGMDGGALADRVQAWIPAIGVLLLGGYALEGGGSPREGGARRQMLRKPFSVESLVEAVRQVAEV